MDAEHCIQIRCTCLICNVVKCDFLCDFLLHCVELELCDDEGGNAMIRFYSGIIYSLSSNGRMYNNDKRVKILVGCFLLLPIIFLR